jgi:hypothetical protein
MRTVILEGNALARFREYCRMGLDGQLGELTAVQVYIDDNGQLVLGTNGFTSEPMGRAVNNFMAPTPAEGSGNPYANVPQEDSPLEERIRLLENEVQWLKDVVTRAELLFGVNLRTSSR